eukprot:gene11608-biopygen10922
MGVRPHFGEKRLGTRPGRVRSFKFYRAGRVRDAFAAVSPEQEGVRPEFRGGGVGRSPETGRGTTGCLATPPP